MSADATTARDLIQECLDSPHLLDEVTDDQDLLAAGINSGELILVTIECERRLGRPITDGELTSMATITDVARLLKAG